MKGFLFFLLSKSRHVFIYPFVDASCTVNGKPFYANQKRSGSTPGRFILSFFSVFCSDDCGCGRCDKRGGGGNYDCCFPRCAAVFSGLAIHLHGTCYVAANARYGPKIAIGHFRVTLGGKVEQVAAQRFGSKVEYLSIIIRDRYTFVRVSYCIDFFAQSLVILRYIFGVLSEPPAGRSELNRRAFSSV